MGILFNKLSASDLNTAAEHLFALYFSECVAMHCPASGNLPWRLSMPAGYIKFIEACSYCGDHYIEYRP